MNKKRVDKWLNDDKTILKSKKAYSHFDYRTNIKKCWSYISNPENIIKHGFYPFIHYEQNQVKYHKEKGKKIKVRNIYYASHIDSCIYQYYSFILNEKYNSRVKADGLNDVAVAYRSGLGLNNIDFAKNVFSFIKKTTSSYVMIGDFTNFFDTLDHKYLKTRLCDLLNIDKLPDDYYAIFKSITKFSYVELSEILKLNGLKNTLKDRGKLNKQHKILCDKKFKNNKKKLIKKNKNDYGIPQGAPISALLSNIYMLDCDNNIYSLVKKYDGLYMRYSDDFIIVIPKISENDMKKVYQNIKDILEKVKNLTLQQEKTQFFLYDGQKLENCGDKFDNNINCKNRFINYLGFTFDGEKATIRDKTISKYYYRMYRKAKTISDSHGYNKKGVRISNKNIYRLYSRKGAYEKPGNFITYVNRAQRIFNNQKSISQKTKNHMQKIKKAINNYD